MGLMIGIQLSCITDRFGRKERWAEDKSVEIENQLELKQAVFHPLKPLWLCTFSLHEFQISGWNRSL